MPSLLSLRATLPFSLLCGGPYVDSTPPGISQGLPAHSHLYPAIVSSGPHTKLIPALISLRYLVLLVLPECCLQLHWAFCSNLSPSVTILTTHSGSTSFVLFYYLAAQLFLSLKSLQASSHRRYLCSSRESLIAFICHWVLHLEQSLPIAGAQIFID